MVGIDQTRVSALLDQRRAAPFRGFAEVAPFTNGVIDTETIQLVGANTWRVTYQRDDLGFLIECRMAITPTARLKAAEVNECRHRPLNSIIADDDAEDFALVFSNERNALNLELQSLSKNLSTPITKPYPTTTRPASTDRDQRAPDNRSLTWLRQKPPNRCWKSCMLNSTKRSIHGRYASN